VLQNPIYCSVGERGSGSESRPAAREPGAGVPYVHHEVRDPRAAGHLSEEQI